MFYILDGKNPVLCEDIRLWGDWFSSTDRHVALDELGRTRISTVFLGVDHGRRGRPLLFETMVFRGERSLDDFTLHYSTWDEAAAGHTYTVECFKSAMMYPLRESNDEEESL